MVKERKEKGLSILVVCGEQEDFFFHGNDLNPDMKGSAP